MKTQSEDRKSTRRSELGRNRCPFGLIIAKGKFKIFWSSVITTRRSMLSVGRPESSSTESSESKISCYSLTVYRCCEVSLNFALLLKLLCT